MIVHTKYSIGDRVWPIGRVTEQVTRDCTRCSGRGELELKEGGTLPCPNRYAFGESCSGGKVTVGLLSPWAISADSVSMVGKVRVERTAYRYASPPSFPADVNEYMLVATGVGSGSIWKEADLFASEAEAQTECARRNADPRFAEERENLLAGFHRVEAEMGLPGDEAA